MMEMNRNVNENPDMERYGARIASENHPNGTLRSRCAALRIRKDVQILEQLCEGQNLASEEDRKWLQDNLYRVRRDGKAAACAYRGAGRIRACGPQPWVQRLADALTEKSGGRLEAEQLRAFLTGVQQVTALTEREISLVPAALRSSLLHRLAESKQDCQAVFQSLSLLDRTDLAALLDSVSTMAQVFQQDPARVYPMMDAESRRDYRRKCALLARKAGMRETEAAALVLRLAEREKQHIGEYLYHRPLGHPRREPLVPFLLLHLLLPLLLALGLSRGLGAPWTWALLLLPLQDGVSFLFHRCCSARKHPERLPRLDYAAGIPEESTTLAVSVVLLTTPEAAQEAAARLEQYRLANRRAGKQLLLGILMDYGESRSRTQDTDAAILGAAKATVRELNRKYGGGFYLFVRERSCSRRDGVWRGSERKRGAILELCALLRGQEQHLECCGAPLPESVKYLIVLDGDTRLNMDTAAELAGTLAHPLHRPEISREGRLTGGHALLQPHLRVSLSDAEKSGFSRIFAGQGGMNPYGGVNSDVYQDLFGQGSYCGKGILDIDAFLRCVGSCFPPERLLSHDLLEGACTGCAYLSDVTLTEGFPSGVLSYYDRQHRWIRGDWQTIPWLLPFVRNRDGERVRNPVPQLSRYKIWDNLCRSLLPAAQLTIALLWLLTGKTAYLGCFLTVLAGMLLRVLPGGGIGGKRYHSRSLSGLQRALYQLVWLLWLLPYTGWVNLHAICCALYRMLVSHRKLLSWVTSAQSEGGAPKACLRRMWPCYVCALPLLLWGTVMGKIAGLLWLLCPAAAVFLSREREKTPRLREADREFLLHCCGDIKRYFDTLVNAERNWLPPDNLQEVPEERIAERTSPTNIGLMLLALLAASDLGLCTEAEVWTRAEASLNTLSRMPKFRGHLYNWVDIRTLQPLNPPYISTVDSGNLLACLVILRSAARTAAPRLLPLLDELIGNMKLDFLYDEKRCLFYLGWDPQTDTPTEIWYDLLESEARTAGFLAVARGEAPKKHWRHLGRTLLEAEGQSGLASWTGTMFEYLMPALFLTEPEGSLLRESRAFCCHVQRSAAVNGIWGVSESAFAETDGGLNYAYKAHGVQKLALCTGMDRERVIAPYASFLALPEGARPVVRNLLRLRRMGMEGRFGFYEALDLTPSRGSEQPVRCYMAHHLAMSLLAADNALCGGILRRRFLADPEMAACQELLEESAPVGQKIRTESDSRLPERPKRPTRQGMKLLRIGADPEKPLFCPLSSGSFHALVSASGYQHCTWNGILLHVCEKDAAAAVPGVLLFAATANGVIPLQAAPDYGTGAKRYSSCDGSCLTVFTEQDGLAFSQRIQVSDRVPGQRRSVTITNRSDSRRELTLALYLEPVLCREAAWESHPAFQRLCLEPGSEDGILCFTHRSGGSEPEAHMAIGCSAACLADTDRALLFGRGGIRNIRSAVSRESRGIRAASEPCAFLRTVLRLQPGEKQTVVYSLAAGFTRKEAILRAADLLTERGTGSGYYDFLLRKWLNGASPEKAFLLLPELVRWKLPLPEAADAGDRREPLWRWGISGDFPVVTAERQDGETALRQWAFLKGLGVSYDLVIFTADSGIYGTPERKALTRTAERLELGQWEHQPGGYHVFPGGKAEWQELSRYAVGAGQGEPKPEALRLIPASVDTMALRRVSPEGQTVRAVTESGVGLRAWTHILSNGRLGWLAADTGCGSMWLDNAREHRLTPWKNDPCGLNTVEELQLVRDGEPLSLFADADTAETCVSYGLGFIRWERKLPGGTKSSVTGFVPREGAQRILLVELSGRKEGDRIRWRLETERRLWLHGDGTETDGGKAGYSARMELKAAPGLCLTVSAEKGGETDYETGKRLLEETIQEWKTRTGGLSLESGCPALDAYLNGWAAYQVLACRIYGRASLYQSGGAYGFRDQLQDICALIDPEPALARSHILRCAAHQYEEGDVMHWWHPQKAGDRGVRTRCSDDLLWLAYAADVYAQKTGDDTIWSEEAPFLRSEPLGETEADRYERPGTGETGTLLEHCRRALQLVRQRGTGPHGLLKMGAGDWNDGYNRVEGESVWLTWFAAMVYARYGTRLPGFAAETQRLARAANGAWADGQYLRGWYADGTPLGAAGNPECAMDSLAQSFAVLSGLGEPEKSRMAVKKAAKELLDRENGLVRLFTPPFDGVQDPGYIRSYLPGVRENGGQYTHAAVWLAAACLRCGETELGWELLRTLLPLDKPERQYQLEPFVLAADVYDNPDMRGRGGWSWYTGAAGWFLRTGVEELLGLHTVRGELRVNPALPADWTGYSAEYQVGAVRYAVSVRKNGGQYGISVNKM